MTKMQTATVMVNIGGDAGNTVEKYNVTVSEIVVLQKIHGSDAVVNIRPGETIDRSSKAERARLDYEYGAPQDDGSKRSKVVDLLFPGAAARLFETFEEAEIDEQFFAQTGRVSLNAVEPLADNATPVSAGEAVAKPKRGKKAETQAVAPAETPATPEVEEDDGIGDMPAPDALFK